MWSGHKKRKLKHQKNGNGFGYSLFKRDAPYVNTISARYWKDGSEVLIDQGEKNPRTLTPLECARLQGFPDNFFLHQSKKANYKQFGNSVAVPVIEAISREIAKTLKNEDPAKGNLFDNRAAVHD
jgi:DNA (cytosine-5)-methyltransferase 1